MYTVSVFPNNYFIFRYSLGSPSVKQAKEDGVRRLYPRDTVLTREPASRAIAGSPGGALAVIGDRRVSRDTLRRPRAALMYRTGATSSPPTEGRLYATPAVTLRDVCTLPQQ